MTWIQDFSPKLPGHDYRQPRLGVLSDSKFVFCYHDVAWTPRSDPRETARIRKETKAKEAEQK